MLLFFGLTNNSPQWSLYSPPCWTFKVVTSSINSSVTNWQVLITGAINFADHTFWLTVWVSITWKWKAKQNWYKKSADKHNLKNVWSLHKSHCQMIKNRFKHMTKSYFLMKGHIFFQGTQMISLNNRNDVLLFQSTF